MNYMFHKLDRAVQQIQLSLSSPSILLSSHDCQCILPQIFLLSGLCMMKKGICKIPFMQKTISRKSSLCGFRPNLTIFGPAVLCTDRQD